MSENGQGFADLRVHSHYSYRDGVSSVDDLVARAVELGRPAMALDDHDHAAGLLELQETADKHGLANPIFGIDIAVRWDEAEGGDWTGASCSLEARRLAEGGKNGQRTYNLLLLAQDEGGLQNLFKLVTWAGTEGYDQSGNECPFLTEEVLLEHSSGIALLSGGVSGKLAQLLAKNNPAEAEKYASRLQEAFGSRFFVELIAGQSNKTLVEFARQYNLPLLATTDVHYVSPEQSKARDLLWAIADNVRLDDPKRRRPSEDVFAHPLTLDELSRIYAEVPEAISNAASLADSCRVRLAKSTLIIPDFPIPADFVEQAQGISPAGVYLAYLAQKGLQERLGALSEVVTARMQYELGVMERAGFSQYILIVADIVQKAQELRILCAPRGSSAGSLVCYALGITPLNPLAYNLVFERFLNEARLAPPDIDLDIADEGRPRLLDYVVHRYKSSNVAHIITHNFVGAKSALRDAGKALSSDIFLVNRLGGLIPIEFQRPYSLTRTLEEVPEVAQLYKQDKAARELLDAAMLIEGTGRNSGTHAAGVVITPRPVVEYVPLTRTEGLGQRQREAARSSGEAASAEQYPPLNVMTQWDMVGVEKRGLLKIDLLGLTAWSAIGKALEFIRRERGEELNVWLLPTSDEKTYLTIAQGYTIGIFQLENVGMTEFAMGMKPRSIEDLALMIAAYRPGPMPFLGKILAVRNGRESLEAPHPLLKPLLAESYGAPVYQETMLRIAQEVAGYSLGEADVLRKAIGKKNQTELVAQRQKFVAGARQKGLTENEAEAIWQFFPPFAFYGFNQAHAIVYGYLTYITAYLKVNYAAEYLGALLSVATDTEGVVKAVGECRRLGVPLLGPDVNHSIPGIGFEQLPDGKMGLRLGLATIKGLGPTGLEAIISARREGGPFNGLGDFIRRVPGRSVNARTLTALARVGALPFGNRAQIEEGIAAAQKAAKGKLFFEPELPAREEFPLEILLTNEFEMLGFHITPVPVTEAIERLAQEGKFDTYTNELATRPDDKPVKMAGAVLGGRQVQARFGTMFVFDLDDGRGMVEVTVLPKLYKEQAALLKEGKILLIEGKIDKREGRARLQAIRLKDEG